MLHDERRPRAATRSLCTAAKSLHAQWKPSTTIITTTWKVNKISPEILFRTTPAFRERKKKKKKDRGKETPFLLVTPRSFACRAQSYCLPAGLATFLHLPATASCLSIVVAMTPSVQALLMSLRSYSKDLYLHLPFFSPAPPLPPLPEESQNKNSNPSTQL